MVANRVAVCWRRELAGAFVAVLFWAGAACAADAPDAQSALTDLVDAVITANKAREDSLEVLRGCFASEYQRSPLKITRDHITLPGVVADDSARSVSAAQFVSSSGRLKMDGVALTGGTNNPWEFVGPSSAPISRPLVMAGHAAPPPPPVFPRPRTVIIRDGQVDTQYSEVWQQWLSEVAEAPSHEPPARQNPLGTVVFGSNAAGHFTEELESLWKLRAPGERPTYSWRQGATEVVNHVPCIRLDVLGKSVNKGGGLKAQVTFWVARNLAFAPVRVEHLLADPPNGDRAMGYQWDAADFREVESGVWLPCRIREVRACVTADGRVEWLVWHRVSLYGLNSRGPVTREDFLMVGPPIGTEIHPAGEQNPVGDLKARHDAWSQARAWSTEANAVELEKQFSQRLIEFAHQLRANAADSAQKAQKQPGERVAP